MSVLDKQTATTRKTKKAVQDELDKEHPRAKAPIRGRKPNKNFLPYLEARDFIQGELIPSRGKYIEWWDINKPKALPRFPYRVYKEWTTWNDFLGTDNKFQTVGKKWRSIDEAVVWVHAQKIGSYKQWMDFCKEQKDKLPADIPPRPDLVYEKWRSWNHWLGNKPKEAVEAKRDAERIKIFYIIRYNDVPGNVFTFGIEEGGISAMKERWEREKFVIIKMFWYEQAKAIVIKNIVDTLSTSYQGDERQRVTPNIFDIIWYLEMQLDIVKLPTA